LRLRGLRSYGLKPLSQIGAMYQHEERIRELGLTGVDKTAYRQEQTAPIVSKFFEWLKEVCCARAFLPSDDFLKAARYALKRRSGLEVFLGNPEVPMDTNHLERALRVIPMGRRNYLFCWSEIGAARVGQIQSLLVTCKLHGIDPYTYLVDVFQRLDTHPQSKVEQLTPRLWKEHFGSNPLLSPLELARQRNLAMAA